MLTVGFSDMNTVLNGKAVFDAAVIRGRDIHVQRQIHYKSIVYKYVLLIYFYQCETRLEFSVIFQIVSM